MGWAHCGTDSKGREIGYSIPATCDHPGCDKKIDRGLTYACGGMHGAADDSCEGYFCSEHLFFSAKAKAFVCEECLEQNERGSD